MILICFRFSVVLFRRPGISICHTTSSHSTLYQLCPRLCFFIVLSIAALFNHSRWIGCQTLSCPRPKAINFSWNEPELSSVAWSNGVQLMILICFRFSVVLFGRPGISICHTTSSHNTLYLLSPRLCFCIVFKRDLFIYLDDSLTS